MPTLANARFTLIRLKSDARQFRAATANGTLTPVQIQKLASMLVDTMDVLDGILNGNTDVALNGSKIGQNDGALKKNIGRTVGLKGSTIGQN